MGSPSFRQTLPWVCFVAVLFLLNYCARGALSPLFPALEESLRIGHGQATSILLWQGLGMSLSLFVGGFLLSLFRPRLMAGFSLCCSGLCFLAVPLCASLDALRVLFFCFGLTAGLYFPAGMTVLGSLVGHKDWGKAVGIHELAPNIGFILFPLLAQGLLFFVPWSSVLAVWGALLLLTGLAFLRYGKGGDSLAEPVSRKGSLTLLKSPMLWLLMFVFVVALIGEYAIYTILPLMLVQRFELNPETANYLLALSRLVAPAMVLVGGWAADTFAVRKVLFFSLGLHTVALVLLAVSGLPLTLLGMVMQSSMIAMTYPALFKFLSLCYPMARQPVVLSLIMPASGLLASGLAPNLLGLAGETIGFGGGILVAAVLSLACIPALGMIRPARLEQGNC